jgi:D-alanyl-D-alanine carboxypeptidase (penicillin-binding protein 5/6)
MSATAERNGMELIAVVMKSPTSAQRFEDVKSMLDYGFSAYSLIEVQPEAPFPPVTVRLGELEQVQPQLSSPARLLIGTGERDLIRTNVVLSEELEAPVEQGQTIGALEIFVGEELKDSIPITAAQEVLRLSFSGILGRMFQRLMVI